MKNILTSILLIISISTFAQTGIGTTTPNANAQLEVASTTKGFLPPRVALTSTTSASPLAAHVAGMVVYNTATVSDVTPGLYVNNGTAWVKQAGVTKIDDLSDARSFNNSSIILGQSSAPTNTSNGNTIIGLNAMLNSTGQSNTSVGYGAGNVLTTGTGNVFLGYAAGFNETGSNKLYISNTLTTAPLIYGEFDNYLVRVNGNLEVSGTIKIEGGTPGAGKVLTSDANGLASWETTNNNIIGEIKQTIGVMPSGWVKLAGQAISSLTSTQQTQASNLGLTGNLPDATNAFLSQNGTTLGSVSGSNSKTIAQNNLPNVTLSGTTSTDGAHTHTLTGTYTRSLKLTGGAADTATGGDITPGEPDLFDSGTPGISTAGDHSHTLTTSSINGGVTQQSFDITPKTISVNTYIYLGE